MPPEGKLCFALEKVQMAKATSIQQSIERRSQKFWGIWNVLLSARCVLRSTLIQSIGADRGPSGNGPLQVFHISCHFALRQSVSQTKHCCSFIVKIFGPSQKFGLVTPLAQSGDAEQPSSQGKIKVGTSDAAGCALQQCLEHFRSHLTWLNRLLQQPRALFFLWDKAPAAGSEGLRSTNHNRWHCLVCVRTVVAGASVLTSFWQHALRLASFQHVEIQGKKPLSLMKIPFGYTQGVKLHVKEMQLTLMARRINGVVPFENCRVNNDTLTRNKNSELGWHAVKYFGESVLR